MPVPNAARLRRLAILAGAVLLVAGLGASVECSARADDLDVEIDQARLLRLPDGVATLVIGNPAIADATLQAGGMLVITGKGYGRTNLIALDARGAILTEHDVTVGRADAATVTVYRGAVRQTLSCAPGCEPTVTLGDGADYFDAASRQVTERAGLAAARN